MRNAFPACSAQSYELRPTTALGFDLQQTGYLHGRPGTLAGLSFGTPQRPLVPLGPRVPVTYPHYFPPEIVSPHNKNRDSGT